MAKADPRILSNAERAARNSRLGLLTLRVLLTLGIVLTSVYGTFETVRETSDAGRSAAFDAAPPCAASSTSAASASATSAAPARDCLAWTPQTVTGVDVAPKAGTTVYLSGGQRLWYDGDTWLDSLATGAAVTVLEWEGEAEALRQPDGVALYSPNSTPFAIYQDVAAVVVAFSIAALMGAALLAMSRLRSSRPRLKVVAVSLAIAGVSGGVASIVIAQAVSFAAGIITGLAVYLALAVAVLAGIAIWRGSRRRRAERLLVPVYRPSRLR